MPNYVSPNRLKIEAPKPIIQPRHPNPKPTFFNTKMPTGNNRNVVTPVNTSVFKDITSNFKKSIDAIKASNYSADISITTLPDEEDVKDLGVVYTHYGKDPLRLKAVNAALKKMRHATPKPALTVMVELVPKGDESIFKDKEGELVDKVITVTETERAKGIFQKEAMWNIGARYIFDNEEITKCLFMDADSSYFDNSWAYYISKDLNQYPFVHPYIGLYYADQPDFNKLNYGSEGVVMSYGYHYKNRCGEKGRYPAPGMAYACTKEFWDNTLGGSWIINSSGSGDAALWRTLLGVKDDKEYHLMYAPILSNLTGIVGNCYNYSKLIAVHHYHGPMVTRAYTVRNYLNAKFSSIGDSDVEPNEEGVLEWKNTHAGNVLMKAVPLMFAMNRSRIAENKKFETIELKKAIQPIINDEYGVPQSPISIVTYYDNTMGCDRDRFIGLLNSIKLHCKNAFRLYCITRDSGFEQYVDEVIYPVFPKVHCSGEWLSVMAFMRVFDGITLAIHPKVNIKHDFTIVTPDRDTVYMARPFMKCNKINRSSWDTSIILHDGCNGLFDTFKQELLTGGDDIPYLRFVDPGDYINTLAYANNYKVRNIKEYIDYAYDKQLAREYYGDIADLILPTK